MSATANIKVLPNELIVHFRLTAVALRDIIDEIHEEEPGTFYLTDYLAKHFDRLIFKTLGIDDHPELFGMYFDNYRRVVHLTQENAREYREAAAAAADRLGLPLRTIFTGWGQLETSVLKASQSKGNRDVRPPVPVAINQ